MSRLVQVKPNLLRKFVIAPADWKPGEPHFWELEANDWEVREGALIFRGGKSHFIRVFARGTWKEFWGKRDEQDS